jgi:hypothetical protein
LYLHTAHADLEQEKQALEWIMTNGWKRQEIFWHKGTQDYLFLAEEE